MKHEHDIDLILAIADGGMPEIERAAAEASLAACEECRTDLRLQSEALVALGAVSPASLTDLERARLHRNVAAEFPPPSSVRAVKPTLPWYQRLMPAMAAAAALIVVVGVGSVLVNPGGDADMAAETTVATGNLRTAADGELPESQAGTAFDDDAAATTTTMAASAPLEPAIKDYGAISGADLETAARELGTTEEATESDEYTSPADLEALSVGRTLSCAEVALEEGAVTAVGTALVDGELVELYRIGDVVKVYSTVDCGLSASFE